MSSGILRIRSYAARQAGPVAGVRITVAGQGASHALITDSAGNAPDLSLPAPDSSYSLNQANTTVLPYSAWTLTAEKEGWETQVLEGVQIFDGQVTLADLSLNPAGTAPLDSETVLDTPAHGLWSEGGSGPAPRQHCTAPVEDDGSVLDAVVIPKQITVHLGKPSASARNVTVSFRHYIANVASSEVYPTWAGQAAAGAGLHPPGIKKDSGCPAALSF